MKTQNLFTILTIGILFSVTHPIQANNTALRESVKHFEELLDPYMEIIDTVYLMTVLQETEAMYQASPNTLHQTQLAIVYHEVALNLGFLENTTYTGYATKSHQLLAELANDPQTPEGLMPFVLSYQASALALMSSETRNLKLLKQAFVLFDTAVVQYGSVCYAPRFMRGSVAENLPWFFFKKKVAVEDFEYLIDKWEVNPSFASNKIMSFAYWAWVNQHKSKRYREQAIAYLHKAIELDPQSIGGRERAEQLLQEFEGDKKMASAL